MLSLHSLLLMRFNVTVIAKVFANILYSPTAGVTLPSISKELMMEISLSLFLSEQWLSKASRLHAVNSSAESIQQPKTHLKDL